MNKCQMLHETIVKDIIDVINNVKDYDEIEWIRNKNNTGSIAKRASNLVLVFPVLVSNSLSIQTATIISKAIERKCVALLRILFSSISFTDADNLQDYLAKFHTNLNAHITLDDFMDVMDKFDEAGIIEVTDRDAYETVKEDMKNINYYLSNSFNETSINDYVSKTDIYGNNSIVLERDLNIDSKAFGDALGKYSKELMAGARGKTVNDNRSTVNRNIYDNRTINDGRVNTRTNNDNRITNNYYGSNRDSKNSDPSLKDQSEFFKNQLLPQDVQKANELMPTVITVAFTTFKEEVKHTQVALVGIKAKLYPIDSIDIVTRLSSKYRDSNNLFNLIRASTREISFFKDLAFAIDKAKLDAVSMARESNNAKMFKLLERRAAKNRFSTLLKKNDASPITSLVISKDEVEYLKKYNNIDMEKSYVTRSILEAYNLMDIVIADEALEVARFLFDDGDGIYETLAFDSLEKEASDSSYKKVINLMSKLNH